MPFGSSVPSGKTVWAAYEESASADRELTIHAGPAAGSQPLTRPVIYPPKIFAVWVPEHLELERDMKIGAHWIFIKLRDSSWVEEPIDREATEPHEKAHDDEVAKAKQLFAGEGLSRLLIPSAAPRTIAPAAGENR
jgi:hypothetical protein